MKIACLLIMVLLATANVNATSRTMHEASSIPASLSGGLGGFLRRSGGGIWNSVGIEGVGGGNQVDSYKMRVKMGDKGGRHVGKTSSSCVTFEYCKKNKIICTKKCKKQHGSVVEGKNIPNCQVKCKKCIPNC